MNAGASGTTPGDTGVTAVAFTSRDALDAFIRAKNAEGWSDRRIARAAGLSPGTLYGLRRRLDLPPAHPVGWQPKNVHRTPANEATLRAMHAAGATDAAVGRVLGCLKQTVTRWRRSLGLPPNRPCVRIAGTGREATMRALVAAGRTDREVGAAVGLSGQTVRLWRRYHCIAGNPVVRTSRRVKTERPKRTDRPTKAAPTKAALRAVAAAAREARRQAVAEVVREMAAAGRTWHEIAERLGFKNRTSIHYWSRKLGVRVLRNDARRRSHVEALAAAGWAWPPPPPMPADLSPQCLRVLLVLLAGPRTRLGVVAAVGRCKKDLLTRMVRRGLVARIDRAAGEFDTRHNAPLYVPTAAALAMLAAAAQEATR